MEPKMSDFKSNLPDLKEVTGMLGKLFTDVKKSIVEIARDYKEKHKEASPAEAPKAETPPAEAPKAEAPVAEAPKAEAPPVEEPPKDE